LRPSVTILAVVGVLILVGYLVVGVEIARRAMGPKEGEPTAAATGEPMRQVPLNLPEGARVAGMVSTTDRVILHVSQPNVPDRIIVLDPKSMALSAGSGVGGNK
jgi:hypothetical protein